MAVVEADKKCTQFAHAVQYLVTHHYLSKKQHAVHQ